ncbi:MAG: glutamine amidotransferase [Armatimonadota bacterium]
MHILLPAALAVALLVVVWLSARALGAATRRQRIVLLGLRTAVFLSFILALLDPQWARGHLRTRLPLVAILVDTSRSMSIADAPDGQTRVERARAVVERTGRALRHDAQVLLWGFDTDARLAELSALEAEGTGTDIEAALRGLKRHVDTERLPAVWLLTDGRDTTADEDEAVAAAAVLDVPINTVALGSDEHPPDIEVWSVLAPKSMRTGERAYAVATIRAPGFHGKQIAVTLRGSDGQSQTANVTIGDGGTGTARFTVAPKQPEMGSYTVGVTPLDGELTDLNNARTFMVSVTQGDRTVLLIDRLRPELKFLRRALDGLTGVKADIYLQKAPDGSFWHEGDSPKRAPLPSASALRRYDAIVVGDVPAKALPTAFLRAAAGFVTERGGGLGLLGGPRSFGVGGYAETALADVLPLRLGGTLDGYLPSAQRVTAGEAADDHPLLPRGGEAIDWSRLPLLEGANLTKGAKPLASVLLEGTGAGQRVPLLAAQRMGAGRALCIASDSTFRWVFSEYATDESARAHAALWQRAIRWLSTSTNERPLSIALDKTACTVGEPVRVIATVLDESFAPVADAQVSATVTRSDAKTTIECHRTGDPGRYESSLRPTADGKHTVHVRAKRGGDDIGSAGGEFTAHTALAELRDVRLNRALLQRLADVSGGSCYEAADAEQAMARPPPALTVAAHRRINMTRSWPYLILVLVLCGLDWGLRRRWNV